LTLNAKGIEENAMQTKIIIGAKSAYARIQSSHVNMDVLLSPGRPASESLRETASEWREKAVRLQQRALLLEEAAAQLDKDQEKKPAFIPL
jgi:hypothetical protein